MSKFDIRDLVGRVTVSDGEPTSTTLRNYSDTPIYLNKIAFEPELPSGAVITELRMGHNSQMACIGSFKASILSRVPAMRLDGLRPSMDVRLDFQGVEEYKGKITVTAGQEGDGAGRCVLFPVGKTQVEGRLVELLATPDLFRAVEEGRVFVLLIQRPDAPPHQEVPVRMYRMVLSSDGRLRPTGPVPCIDLKHGIDFACGVSYRIDFKGELAEGFDQEDVLGILEPT